MAVGMISSKYADTFFLLIIGCFVIEINSGRNLKQNLFSLSN